MTPIEKCLFTWYPTDHPLHLDPLHPVIGLAGEAGELLNLYKKERFKEGFSWWDCAKCNHHVDPNPSEELLHSAFLMCPCDNYTPKILDELGDLGYYKQMLDYVAKHPKFDSDVDEITILLADLNLYSAQILHSLIHAREIDTARLELAQSVFERLLELLGTILEDLTELNWNKLKDGDNNGWGATNQAPGFSVK